MPDRQGVDARQHRARHQGERVAPVIDERANEIATLAPSRRPMVRIGASATSPDSLRLWKTSVSPSFIRRYNPTSVSRKARPHPNDPAQLLRPDLHHGFSSTLTVETSRFTGAATGAAAAAAAPRHPPTTSGRTSHPTWSTPSASISPSCPGRRRPRAAHLGPHTRPDRPGDLRASRPADQRSRQALSRRTARPAQIPGARRRACAPPGDATILGLSPLGQVAQTPEHAQVGLP